MVMAPALPNLSGSGVRNKDNNPAPSKAKVDTGVANHTEGPGRVNLGDAQTLGIWNLMKQADDPSHVAHLYRQYRDSKHCSVPKDHLRRMRDVMVSDMHENERNSPTRKKQKQVGHNVPWWDQLQIRRGA
jgi:hypothetical protein